ncbi:hypothetical protein ACIBCO_39235 [Streptomyces violascens]
MPVGTSAVPKPFSKRRAVAPDGHLDTAWEHPSAEHQRLYPADQH